MTNNAYHQHVPLSQLLWTMLYVGIAGYGGGPAIIAFFKEICVNRREWLSEDEFVTGVSLSQTLPGANALSIVVYLGFQLCGPVGALTAPVCFLFPSLILMTALSAGYFAYGTLPVARALFTGLGAIVVGLLLNALLVMARPAIKDIWAACIALGIFLLMQLFSLTIPLAIVASALVGLALYYRPKAEVNGNTGTVAQFSLRNELRFWGSWLIVFVVVAIVAYLTRHTATTRLLLSLLRVGILTFGGGYSSVALFQHEAVAVHHWLTNRQFVDGLALGQITPGPVLITATFIGYRVLGILGAVIATLAVFAPGGLAMYFVVHQHEQLKQLRWLQAMVRGIIAGFIGVLLAVMVSLSIQSITGWKTALFALASAAVLIFAKKDPLWVIIGGAILSVLVF